jgi:hypothetical protein
MITRNQPKTLPDVGLKDTHNAQERGYDVA